MMQWLGPDFDHEIIYNDFRDGKFCSVILDVFSGAERVLAMPVYSVAADGSFALTLDFSRLHRLRPGYGYSNIQEASASQKLPQPQLSGNSISFLISLRLFSPIQLSPHLSLGLR